MIYLDSASTAEFREVDNIIISAMTNAMKDYWQNPSSLYATAVRREINKSRTSIAKFINASGDEIYFTSGASESNNWAIRGWVNKVLKNTFQDADIITTKIEHKSILEIVKNKDFGVNVYYCDVDEFGVVDNESLECLLKNLKKLDHRQILVSIGMANNEIGTIQYIKEISDLVHKYGGILHTDATQALPYMPVDVEKLGIDMLSASGHKFSPVLKGVGFLYKRNSIDIQPLIYGAQENGLRGGTENTFGIIGLGEAIKYCDVSQKRILEMYDKTDCFIEFLKFKFGCRLNGASGFRLPNNVNVTFPQNITGEALLYMLDLSGISISTGSACNSSSIEPSHVLKAIGLSDKDAMRTVRFTISLDTTYEDISRVIDEIGKAIKIIEA